MKTTPKQYKKKPITISALQFDGENLEDIRAFCTPQPIRTDILNTVVIPTREGDMVAGMGDYIIRGVKGEFYPCKPDIFAATYEEQ
jgi:hypothetical protein